MKSLTPYPPSPAAEDKLVKNVELFANTLIKISHIAKKTATPITFFPSIIKHHLTQKKWRKRAHAVPRDERIPLQQKAVYVANKRQAMDQNFFYALKDGRIWMKPIAGSKYNAWKLFGPDGLPPTNVKLKAMSSDGEKIVAIDKANIVNYVITKSINFYLTDKGWKITNIKLPWRDRWFAMPIINRIAGLVQGKYLQLPPHCIAFGISQKGPETGYYTDMSGKKQPEFLVGVTTLYALCKNGRIYFADPWLGNGFGNEITAPEDGQFVAQNMAVSASTLFLMRLNQAGKAFMYTRLADFDTIGADPILPASYNPDNKIPLVRRLPAEDWIKQPEIPLKGKTKLTSHIAILQTGRGQNQRQLRIEGRNADGDPGYYYKFIYENKWHFELTKDVVLHFKNNVHHTAVKKPLPPIHFQGELLTYKQQKILPIKSVSVKKFLRHGLNERGLHTTAEISLNNGRKLILPLYARRGLTHLFGLKPYSPNWVLVMPKEYNSNDDIEANAVLKFLFKSKMKIPVIVNEFEDGNIEIINKHIGFKFALKPMAAKQKNSSLQNTFQRNT